MSESIHDARYCWAWLFIILAGLCSACARNQPLDSTTPAYSARVINPKLVEGLYEPVTKAFLIVGSDGSVLRSENGIDWVYANVPVTVDLKKIAADATGKVMLAVSEQGIIIRSEDGGLNWDTVATDNTNPLYDVIYHSASGTWIAAGAKGTILRSHDAGKTWKGLESRLDVSFQSLFVNPSD